MLRNKRLVLLFHSILFTGCISFSYISYSPLTGYILPVPPIPGSMDIYLQAFHGCEMGEIVDVDYAIRDGRIAIKSFSKYPQGLPTCQGFTDTLIPLKIAVPEGEWILEIFSKSGTYEDSVLIPSSDSTTIDSFCFFLKNLAGDSISGNLRLKTADTTITVQFSSPEDTLTLKIAGGGLPERVSADIGFSKIYVSDMQVEKGNKVTLVSF